MTLIIKGPVVELTICHLALTELKYVMLHFQCVLHGVKPRLINLNKIHAV